MAIHLSHIPGKMKTVLWGENWLDIFLYLLFLSFFVSPFIDSVAVRVVTSVVYSLLMIAGVVSMSRNPAIRVAAGILACIAITLRWMKHVMPTPTVFKLGTLAVLIFMIMLTVVTLAKVFSKGPVTTHRVKGAIAVYLLFGMTWALLYCLLDQSLPNAFNLPAGGDIFTPERQETLTYFSFITLTTLGYGDITPVHEISRMFVVMEALCGQLYPATLLARLVSLQLMSKENP
jgi:Ion channel